LTISAGRAGAATALAPWSERASSRASTRSPTWSRTAACYRFATKLREQKPLLDACLSRVVASLSERLPEYGVDVAIDASDLPAYANGQRYVSNGGAERERFSDPDASWGHRSAISTRKGGGFYGYKLNAAVCARTELPVAWKVETARTHEASLADDLLGMVRERVAAQTATLDKGYDTQPVHDACRRNGMLPVIPLKQTHAVKRGEHHAPTCEHGTWTFAGADFKNARTKWRCPTGECKPASVWRKASRLHPLIPRESKRYRDLYRGRGAVERTFGRLKHDFGLRPLRTRGLARVQLHADLTMLAVLSAALARARAVPLAA
jgi:hypothetical protein